MHVRWGGWGEDIDVCTFRMAMALAIFLSLFRPFFVVCFETTICLRALASVCIKMAGTPSLYDIINYDVIITSLLLLLYDVINYDIITTSLSLLYDVINYDVIITSVSLWHDVINYDVIITSLLLLLYDVINYDIITTSLSLLYDVINYDVIITSLSLLESSSSLPCSSSPVKKNFRTLTRI